MEESFSEWAERYQKALEDEAKKFPGHPLDEDGFHDADSCYECLLTKEVKGDCRCAECCKSLIIEVLPEDAIREPKIAEQASPILGSPDENGNRELEGYILNTRHDFACVFLDEKTNLCGIYETRPLACRLFSCDGEDRDQLVQLGILPPRE